MNAILRHRAEIERFPGGRYLVMALEELVTAINTPPVQIGTTKITAGSWAPENKVVGSIGDLYLRTDGSTSTTLYVKTSGSNSSTGWTAK